ncbi:alpha/beta fold hydrolase [Paenibacillus riograndensis]|uniref:Alpha/beta hydrolase fold protein n=1 Tax=Paenibacillus riograndensis SBR5 TaxID=1073571 RepID=A0A0E4H9S8_9BACL|nr:alpha/beta hydrolase [Paenibacillus riograndensis]CQR54484.1 alpha/beta hydrolase fold protein [Paenibacillus riograndensis SBR5]
MVKVFKSEAGKEAVLHSYNMLLRQWNTEIQELDIETPYGTTHCIVAGNAANPPLLLFHGVGDNSAVMWLLNMKELVRHFYCIAVDTIGGPGKSVPNGNYSKQTFRQVEWISSIADSLNLTTFNIAGVSNGAYMAFNYATQKSERVERVVCMEGGMVTAPFKAMLQTLLMMFPEILVPTRNNLLKVVDKLSSPDSRLSEKHPEVAEHLVLLMKNHNQQAMFIHKLELYDKEKAVAVKEKLYFLIGEYKLDRKRDFIKLLTDGGFRYQVIPGAGHGINHEQPEAVNRETVGFLLGKEV